MKDRAGRFETAEGGTIFLDEVEIPWTFRTSCCACSGKRYERVGDRADGVRIVATTNRDLKQAVAAGGFGKTLLPPARLPIQSFRSERRDDIPLLASISLNSQ